jgi:hypothetical protein
VYATAIGELTVAIAKAIWRADHLIGVALAVASCGISESIIHSPAKMLGSPF